MLGRGPVRSAPTGALLALTGVLARAERLRGAPGEINPNSVRYLTRTGTYSIEKASRLLAFAPTVTLEEGMRRSEEWLRGQGMLDVPS
jgi:nucleoside-diphosphate-sugar epimerase